MYVRLANRPALPLQPCAGRRKNRFRSRHDKAFAPSFFVRRSHDPQILEQNRYAATGHSGALASGGTQRQSQRQTLKQTLRSFHSTP